MYIIYVQSVYIIAGAYEPPVLLIIVLTRVHNTGREESVEHAIYVYSNSSQSSVTTAECYLVLLVLCADFTVQKWEWPGDKGITSDNVDLSMKLCTCVVTVVVMFMAVHSD